MNGENEKGTRTMIENPKVVVPGRKRKQAKILTIILVGTIVLAGLAIFFLNSPGSNTNQQIATTVTSADGTSVTIPLSSITSTSAWYQYSVDGTWVRFFAVRDSADVVHVAFDECPYCYHSHQGFRQNGTVMVENCCDMEMAISDITEAGCSGGGCHPAYLASHIEDGTLIILVSDLETRAYLFMR